MSPTAAESFKKKGGTRETRFLRQKGPSKAIPSSGRLDPDVFRSIVETGNDGILVLNSSGRIIYANKAASRILGIPEEELIGKEIYTVLDGDLRSFLQIRFREVEPSGDKFCFETTVRTPEGQLRDAEVCITTKRASDWGIAAYVYIHDITEQKRYARSLEISEERLRTLFERVKHGLFICSRDGRLIDCNRAMLEMLGYEDKDELLRLDTARDLYVNPADQQRFQRGIEEDGYVKDMEVELRKKNGEKITLLLEGHAIRNEEGDVIGYEGIGLDISKSKRIEEELRKANEFFNNLIQSSVDGIIAADMKGNIFIFNKGAEELTGYKAEEVIGKINISDIYPKGIAKEVMRKLRSPDYGGVGKLLPTRFDVLNRAGEKIPIQLSAALIYDGSGKEVASVGIFSDLRHQLEMEKKLQETHLQLVSSEKMASLGKLAAGIAHEINNPLGGILIYASLMMEELPENDPRRQDLLRIVQEASRCKDIVKSLLEFARQTEPKLEPTDINRAITDGLFFLENQALFYNVKIVRNLDPSIPPVLANAGQLKQVFINMIVNAAEAMHGNGTLTITTTSSPDGSMVYIEFSDTGEGISDENLPRIFDPFFTTKEVGKGTGLGLSTSYGIIESHGGKIRVKSKVGVGTTFTIELPAARENSFATMGAADAG